MNIAFPDRDYAAYIFDCDGTLIDSMPVHFRAWVETLRDHDFAHPFSEDTFYALGGVPTTRIVEVLNDEHATDLDPVALADAKEETYLRLLPHVEPIGPVVKFARDVAGRGLKVAVASGGRKSVVQRALFEAGLADLFPVVVTPEDVERGKPAPDLFLLAARRLGVEPADCLVLEDAELGRQAAVAAGMDYLMVPSARTRARRGLNGGQPAAR